MKAQLGVLVICYSLLEMMIPMVIGWEARKPE
jgi:hypothetical protein